MARGRFADEFRAEAVRQVVVRGYSVTDVAKRLGVSAQSLYKWVKVVQPSAEDARIMRANKIAARRDYKTFRHRYSKPAQAAPNRLGQQFVVDAPDRAWVTDITYIRTYQGWLYLAVVLDLFSRKVIGWSMKSTLAKELALDSILMAAWRRKPTQPVIIHSDQGSQYGSDDWKRFCDRHQLQTSMSRRGNCYGNAVPESFLAV